MVQLQTQSGLHHDRVRPRRQLREDVVFLVLMMLACRGRGVADDIGGQRAGLGIDCSGLESRRERLELAERDQRLSMALVEDGKAVRRRAGPRVATGRVVDRAHESA